jgi:hypothetical protein
LVPDIWSRKFGAGHLVPDIWYRTPGAGHLVPDIWYRTFTLTVRERLYGS